MNVKVKVTDGWASFPASLTFKTGAPRFHVTFPISLANDAGVRYLLKQESRQGYEVPTRNLVERTLRSGDLFVDVGAHFGFFTLQAVTHPAGNVQAVAFEAEPLNAAVLHRNIVTSGLIDVARVVCAACGDRFEIAPLISNPTMMNSIRGVGLKPPYTQGLPKWVPVVTLDTALSFFPQAANSRLILKVDVEGYEPQVMAGAARLLAEDRVALIIWEYGPGFADGAERAALIQMLAALDGLGFRHFRPPSQDVDGELVPFCFEDIYVGNVFSFSAGLAP